MSITKYLSLLSPIRKPAVSGPHIFDQSDPQAVKLLFHHVAGFTRDSGVKERIESSYRDAAGKESQAREKAFIAAYISAEASILKVSNRLDGGVQGTKALRDDVYAHIDLSALGKHFRFIFLPDSQQAVMLYTLGVNHLLEYAAEYVGAGRVAAITAKYTQNELISQSNGNATNQFDLTDEQRNRLYGYSVEKISQVFKELFEGFYRETVQSVGEAYAVVLFGRLYGNVKSTYPYDIVGLFLDAMPDLPFDAERKSLMSRRDLEITIASATEQLVEIKSALEEKVKLMEEQNKTLESTKKAVLNVLDDAQILEENLKKERDRAKAIIASMSEGLFVVDPSNVVTILNSKALAIVGMNADDAVGKKLSEITTIYKDGTQLREDEQPLAKTLRSGQTVVGGLTDNYSLKSASGIIPITFATAPLRYEDRVAGALVTFRDGTAEKEAKDTIERTVIERTRELREKNEALVAAKEQVSEGWLLLQKEKARLTASINSLPLGFILTDVDENIFIINPAAERILGALKPIVSFAEFETHFGSDMKLHEAHEKCRTERVHIDLKDILLGAKYLHIFFSPIVLAADGGKYIGSVVLLEDVTEGKVIERSKDEFFSIASHELRTPLTAIRGNASMITDYFKEALKDPQLSEMIGDIHESSVRLIDIVNDFLDVSRLEQKRFDFKKEVFDIVEIVKSVISEFQVTGSQHKLSIILEDPPQPVIEVLADKNRTKQVLLNLVGNAIKFTEVGGVTLRITILDNGVEVSIADTGRGISMENQGFLFHKFQQAGESLITRDATRGTGLGLYISKLMVEGMGGTIYLVRSEVGKGSVFAFTTPKHV